MSSDNDDEFLAVAQFDKSNSKLAIQKTANSSDDDVPIFNFNKLSTKPKIKSFGFATKLSSIIQPANAGDEKLIVPTIMAPIPVFISMLNQPKKKLPTIKQLAPLSPVPTNVVNNLNENKKRERSPSFDKFKLTHEHDEVELAPNKKTRTEIASIVPDEPVKYKLIENGNMRRLNMKCYKSRGKPGQFGGTGSSKGAKYKRFKWKKNNFENAGKAMFGVQADADDDDKFNYNLIGLDLPTVNDEGEEKSEEELDPESAEAKFNQLRVKISPKKTTKKTNEIKPKNTKVTKPLKVMKFKENIYEKKDADIGVSSDDGKIKKSRKLDKYDEKSVSGSDCSMNLMLDDSDASPVKKVKFTRKSVKKTVLDSASDSENSLSSIAEAKPVKKSKKKVDKKKETMKENSHDSVDYDGVKPVKKIIKTKRMSKKAKEAIEAIDRLEMEEANNSEDNELLGFVESNGGKLEEPKPLFELNSDGSLPALPQFAYKILEKDFGHKSFRPHQAESILRIACGLSTVVVLSTGYGKSLIYQMAAKLYAKRYPGSCVLVVSPLISLMQDQLYNLCKSLKAAVCDSQLSEKDYAQLLVDLEAGKINILYMSPEAIIRRKIRSIPRIAFVCIDEIHCLSQWSHNFRPSYLQLSEVLMQHYKVNCILGLTATATQQTINEIKSYFNIDTNNIMLSCKLPNNLLVSVSEDRNKEQALVNLFKCDEFQPYFHHVIVYCSRRELTEKIALLLRLSFETKKKINLEELAAQGPYKKKKVRGAAKAKDDSETLIAEAYHAGLTSAARKRIQNQFIKGKLRVIVATMAFGMGIDMKNIRAVIHFNMPKSIENYVQEIGRAGRDNQLSRCHLFLETQKTDINDVKKHIHGDGYDNLIIKKLIIKIFDQCNKSTCQYIERPEIKNDHYSHHVALPVEQLIDLLDIKEETILTLLCYLQSAKYIKLFSNVSMTCTIKSYKGANYFATLARENEFMASVMKHKTSANDYSESAEVVVNMMELCNALDGDYWIIRNHLKQLEWNINEFGKYKSKSGLSCSFTVVSFYMKRRCILNNNELDDIYEHLWDRVTNQVEFNHMNFNALYRILNEHSYRHIGEYIDTFSSELLNEEEGIDEVEVLKPERHMTEKNNKLKEKLNEYFMNELDLKEYSKKSKVNYVENPALEDPADISYLVSSINQFINMYSHEMKLNGHIIARIFHGIGTPKFPAEVWGRQRNFWRAHLCINFEKVVQIAKEQLVNLK